MNAEKEAINTFSITQPDDFHLHLRDGELLNTTVAVSASQFSRAMVMPNIKPAATSRSAILEYRDRILAACPEGSEFEPLMTLYLTDLTDSQLVQELASEKSIIAAKLYPAGATTNSDQGVTDLKNIYSVLDTMQKYRIVLSIHCEVANPQIDPFEREARFIDSELIQLTRDFPELRIVCEHASTKDLINFVQEQPDNIAATITPHHLWLNRCDIFANGLNPFHWCLPVLKHRDHQAAIIQAAISGNPKFFAGTDSAPHPRKNKLSGNAPAGIFCAPVAMPIYTAVFENAGALDKLENFVSRYGAGFYNLPVNTQQITLTREPWKVPQHYSSSNTELVPLWAGKILEWQIS